MCSLNHKTMNGSNCVTRMESDGNIKFSTLSFSFFVLSWDLVAHWALEAPSVPLVPTSQLLLCGINRFCTLRALGHLYRLERHLRFLSARCRFAWLPLLTTVSLPCPPPPRCPSINILFLGMSPRPFLWLHSDTGSFLEWTRHVILFQSRHHITSALHHNSMGSSRFCLLSHCINDALQIL